MIRVCIAVHVVDKTKVSPPCILRRKQPFSAEAEKIVVEVGQLNAIAFTDTLNMLRKELPKPIGRFAVSNVLGVAIITLLDSAKFHQREQPDVDLGGSWVGWEWGHGFRYPSPLQFQH